MEKYKIQRKSTGGDILGAASSVVGAINPIAGAAVGAAGAVVDLFAAKKKAKQLAEQQMIEEGKEELANMSDGFAKGGKIKGKGTATSDSIDAEKTEGEFVVPAENSKEAMALGKKYLGWKDGQTATLHDGETPVKLSNGEALFTKDEAEYLTEMGVDLKALAPKGTPGTSQKLGDFIKNNAGELMGAAQVAASALAGKKNANEENNTVPVRAQTGAMTKAADDMKAASQQAAQAIMNGERPKAAMADLNATIRKTGGSNAASQMSASAQATNANAEEHLKTKAAAANVALSGVKAAGDSLAEGAKLKTQGEMFNKEIEEKRLARKGDAATAVMLAGATNLGNAVIEKYKARADAENDKKSKNINYTGANPPGGTTLTNEGEAKETPPPPATAKPKIKNVPLTPEQELAAKNKGFADRNSLFGMINKFKKPKQ